MADSPIFDLRFRKTLGEILRRAPRLRGGGRDTTRSRRRRLSQSGTFSGHRAYSEGEDVRNLDWNVYARTDELFLKVLEDEDRIGMTVILDRSASMRADDRWPAAVRLAAILGGLALVQLDGLHFVWGPQQDTVLVGAAALGRYLEQLEGLSQANDSPTELSTGLLEHPVGRLAWISDFADPTSFVTALAMLRKHGCRCRGYLPQVESDNRPTAAGYVRFRDPETGAEEVLQVDARLRVAMAEQLRLLHRQQDGVFRAAGYQLQRFPVPAQDDYGVAAWTDGGAIYDV